MSGPWPGARIDYDTVVERHSSGLFLPSRWQIRTLFKDNSASMTKKYTVTSQSINRALPKDAYEVTFPVGASVYDDKFSHSIAAQVQADGSYKPHPSTEPERLKAFESEQRRQNETRINFTILGIGGFLVALAGSLFIFKFRRNRAQTTNSSDT